MKKAFTAGLMILLILLGANVYAQETQVNVALGKSVTSSGGDTPYGLTDGNKTSAVNPNAWRIQPAKSNGAWATINLGQEYVISKIIVYNGYPTDLDSKATEFSVYYASLDSPEQFILLKSVKNVVKNDDQTVITLNEPVGAAYIKFVSDAQTTSVMRIREIEAYETNNGEKKVYALYHGYRRTRSLDGDLGSWKQFYKTPNSTLLDYVNYNADLLDEDGKHQLAAANGEPVVGMQSDNDTDYMEYQILLAKMAGINGFMIDFPFKEQANNTILMNFLKQAEKYSFEIGVDYTDSQLIERDWITNYRDDIITREDRVDYLKENIQYLLDNVYSSDSAAKYNNHPIMYMFGGGLTTQEMSNVASSIYTYPENTGSIYYIHRMSLDGTYNVETDSVLWSSAIAGAKGWQDIGVDVFPWIVPRVRQAGAEAAYDTYATSDDALSYISEYSKLWGTGVNINSGFVFPGMNNTSCGGWGENPICFIDRENGENYKNQWEFHVQNRNNIDIMFIGSWSDFTEGHEIAPTEKNGYREIEITRQYAAQFKGESPSVGGVYIELPQRLFEIRKALCKLSRLGIGTAKLTEEADITAMMISSGEYTNAEQKIQRLSSVIDEYKKAIEHSEISVDETSYDLTFTASSGIRGGFDTEKKIYIQFSDALADRLKNSYFDGKMSFSYFADNDNLSADSIITIKNSTEKEKPPKIGTTQGSFDIAAQINRENTNEWEASEIELLKENCSFTHSLPQGADFLIGGTGEIKDISMSFDILSVPDLRSNDSISVFNLTHNTDGYAVKLLSNVYNSDTDVFAAMYDSKDKLIDTRKFTSDDLSGIKSINADRLTKKIKFFVWNNGITPLEEKIDIDIK